MTWKEIVDSILKLIEMLTSWPVLLFIAVVGFRGQIKDTLLDLLKRISKAPGGWEFREALQEVQSEVASLVNQSEIAKDQAKPELKVDPKKIRIDYTSAEFDAKYWSVRVWLDAPKEILSQIEKVTYERHPTFKKRFMETTLPPFEDSFKCWGEFTMKAEIRLKNGQILRRQRYLSLEVEESQ